ncbi:MAG: hypothetical protein KDA28_02425, partial [Phycisphaerales bacterium]|nr:hypothetical protein [Phycisphaerales bacterium]
MAPPVTAALVVVLGLVCGAGGVARAQLVTEAGATVADVRFEGNRIVEGERLLQEIRTRPGVTFDPDVVDEDVKSLYRLGLFRDIAVEETDVPGGIVVTFVLKENPRIREVVVEGADELDEDKVREVIQTAQASLLDADIVREDVRRIRALYDSEGYTDARVTSVIENAGDSVDVVFRILENEEVFVVEISFSGNEAFDDDELRDVMTTEEKWWLSWLTDDGLYRKESLEGDVARISAFYLNYGYLDHRISEPELSFEEDGLHVHIDIDEGPAYTVSGLSIEGDSLDGSEGTDVTGLAAGLSTTVGEVLSRDVLRQDIEALTQVY